jgi:hypothetical protein
MESAQRTAGQFAGLNDLVPIDHVKGHFSL